MSAVKFIPKNCVKFLYTIKAHNLGEFGLKLTYMTPHLIVSKLCHNVSRATGLELFLIL